MPVIPARLLRDHAACVRSRLAEIIRCDGEGGLRLVPVSR